MLVMAIIIALLGAALLLAEKRAQHSRKLNQLTLRDTLVIGLRQALAVFPGVSRSGSTITAGLAARSGTRNGCADFRFCSLRRSLPGQGLKSLTEIYSASVSGGLAQSDLFLFPIGVIAAAISGYLTIRFLLRFLQSHPIDVFVYYRWGLAIPDCSGRAELRLMQVEEQDGYD